MNSKIDIQGWKRFNLYDDRLFSIDSGNKFDKSKMSLINPTVNFVSRSNNNNGIACIVDEINGVRPYNAGNMTIALGGEYLGSCFVQEHEFYTSQNVNVLIPKWNMSDYVKRFISFVIFKESRSYYKAFEDELNRHMTTDFCILLPIDCNGNSDWMYMKKYMKDIEEKTKKRINILSTITGNHTGICTSNWHDFKIQDLFITENNNHIQTPTGAAVSKKDLREGNIPRISASGNNNGIIGYYSVNNNKNYRVFENFISVSFLGTIFYHPYKASLDMKVHCLQLIDEQARNNPYINLFLVTALQIGLMGNYVDQISSKLLPTLYIKLPSTDSGTPDWSYMDSYMRNLESKVSPSFYILRSITRNSAVN